MELKELTLQRIVGTNTYLQLQQLLHKWPKERVKIDWFLGPRNDGDTKDVFCYDSLLCLPYLDTPHFFLLEPPMSY